MKLFQSIIYWNYDVSELYIKPNWLIIGNLKKYLITMRLKISSLIGLSLILFSCTPEDGVDGRDGTNGQDGSDGQNGISIGLIQNYEYLEAS